jgi:hypothetical protein
MMSKRYSNEELINVLKSKIRSIEYESFLFDQVIDALKNKDDKEE